MVEVNQTKAEYFPEYDAMEIGALHTERERILTEAGGPGNMASASDDALARLIAVNRALRKKAAAPGGVGARRKTSAKQPVSLESLA